MLREPEHTTSLEELKLRYKKLYAYIPLYIRRRVTVDIYFKTLPPPLSLSLFNRIYLISSK